MYAPASSCVMRVAAGAESHPISGGYRRESRREPRVRAHRSRNRYGANHATGVAAGWHVHSRPPKRDDRIDALRAEGSYHGGGEPFNGQHQTSADERHRIAGRHARQLRLDVPNPHECARETDGRARSQVVEVPVLKSSLTTDAGCPPTASRMPFSGVRWLATCAIAP